jgi:hypothetical protein
MEAGGWRLPKFAAFMVTAAETAGGIGLLLGVSAAAFWSDPFNVPFMMAIAAALLTWILLNGTNPIHFTAPEVKPMGA